MSTDGVKIIDGDTARDTYWGILDLFDNGATSQTIRTTIPFPQADFYDDFDYEVYVTAYALAMWEIGFITGDIVSEVKHVIDKGACVKVWTDAYGPASGKQRQKVLGQLWSKISSKNTRVRKRKKYAVIKQLLFSINDVLSFQADDTYHYATVLLNVIQYRDQCEYRFGIIQYQSKLRPTINDIENCAIAGRKISSAAMDYRSILSMSGEELLQHGGLEEILNKEAERTGRYDIGMTMIGIDHRALINFTDRLINIGHLNLKAVCRQMGSLRAAETFNEFILGYHERYAADLKQGTFQIRQLID